MLASDYVDVALLPHLDHLPTQTEFSVRVRSGDAVHVTENIVSGRVVLIDVAAFGLHDTVPDLTQKNVQTVPLDTKYLHTSQWMETVMHTPRQCQ